MSIGILDRSHPIDHHTDRVSRNTESTRIAHYVSNLWLRSGRHRGQSKFDNLGIRERRQVGRCTWIEYDRQRCICDDHWTIPWWVRTVQCVSAAVWHSWWTCSDSQVGSVTTVARIPCVYMLKMCYCLLLLWFGRRKCFVEDIVCTENAHIRWPFEWVKEIPNKQHLMLSAHLTTHTNTSHPCEMYYAYSFLWILLL